MPAPSHSRTSAFDFQLRTRIVYGPGKLDSLGSLAGELGARRAVVVTDPGVAAAGHTERGLRSLRDAGIETHCFDGVCENPSTREVNAGLQIAKRYDPELIVGLGGGSAMDCAKGINFLYTNGGKMQDYWGVGKALKPMLPMIAVPTTAGTGSESQSFALISDEKTHVKMACGDKKASFRIALLDPTITVTQPRAVTALTGVDAMAHALETYVSKPRNTMSLTYSREAWCLLSEYFSTVLDEPDDLEARGAMQIGACVAGLAIENSMLGITHALANPLTATYGIVHGQAIGIMLPHVIRFNAERVSSWYDELTRTTASRNTGISADSGAEGISDFISNTAAKAGLMTRLSDCQVDESRLPDLAESAAQQWTAQFNPRESTAEQLLKLYQQAM
ncbi:MAG: iron-containing alcohol dehydrogenase [Pirellulaceae bacterium]